MSLTNEMIEAGLPHLSAFASGQVGQADTMRRMYEITAGGKIEIPEQEQQQHPNQKLAEALHGLSQAADGNNDAIQQVYAAHTVLWLALATALIRSGAVERYEIVEGFQEALRLLGEQETGLVGDMAHLMKSMIMSGVEALPQIDPTTRSTLDQISKP